MSVDERGSGQRIDNFLLRELKGVPRTLVYRLLRRGEVRVNGGRIRPGYRVRDGDQVRLPPVRGGKASTVEPSQRVLDRLAEAILFESDDLLVVNKPTGLAVHGGSGLAYGVVEALRRLRPELRFLDLAHRLDRQTSGVLVLCKRRGALSAVHEQFRAGEVDKHYSVLLAGRLPRGELPVNAPLARRTGRGGETAVRVAADGKVARTRFTVRERLGDWTLAQAELLTGRMHQIRVHARHVGMPVVGDQRYGDDAVNATARGFGLRRLFLHAATVSLRHPDGTPLTLSAPLAGDLDNVLERLRHE